MISPDYIKNGIRGRVQEDLTRTLGYRTERDAWQARERQITQHRYTSIDRHLEKKAGPTREITFEFSDRKSMDERLFQARLQEIRRLKELEAVGVATKVGAMTWKLDPQMKDKLREAGVVESREKILAKNRKKLSDPLLPLAHDDLKQPGDHVAGQIVGVGLDPETEKEYLLLEGIDGRAHFVTASEKILRARREQKLADGTFVSLTVREFTKDGKDIRYLDIQEPEMDTAVDAELSAALLKDGLPLLMDGINPHTFAGRFRAAAQARFQQWVAEEFVEWNEEQERYTFKETRETERERGADVDMEDMDRSDANRRPARSADAPEHGAEGTQPVVEKKEDHGKKDFDID